MIVGAIVTTASVLFLHQVASTSPWNYGWSSWPLGVVGLSLMAIFARELVHKYRVGVRGMLLAH